MHSAVTVLTVCAGLVFSLSCALLVEKLIFGGLFRFMAAHVPAREEVEIKREDPARFVKYTHRSQGTGNWEQGTQTRHVG